MPCPKPERSNSNIDLFWKDRNLACLLTAFLGRNERIECGWPMAFEAQQLIELFNLNRNLARNSNP